VLATVRPTATVKDVIRAAVAAFNRGDPQALSVQRGDARSCGSDRTTHQQALGCSPMPSCRAGRPLPPGACETGVSLKSVHLLDDRRAVCHLVIGDSVDVAGIYAVDEGRITAACHYFSDLDLLVKVGILGASDLGETVPGTEACA
jgi:hypothetical protein